MTNEPKFTVGQAVKFKGVGLARVQGHEEEGYLVDAYSKTRGYQGRFCSVAEASLTAVPVGKAEDNNLLRLEIEQSEKRADTEKQVIEMDRLLDLLAKETRPAPDTLESNAFNWPDLLKSLQENLPEDPDQRALVGLRFEDSLAMASNMTSSYRGLKRTTYQVGERVKPRLDGNPTVLHQHCKDCPIDGGGTVVEGNGLVDCFPRRPGQPRGITVRWDGMAETDIRLVYVTELEPE